MLYESSKSRDYGTEQQRVSYDVQPTNDQCKKGSLGGSKMLHGSKICNITADLLSNGMLSH
jgi:hypothetical protein